MAEWEIHCASSFYQNPKALNRNCSSQDSDCYSVISEYLSHQLAQTWLSHMRSAPRLDLQWCFFKCWRAAGLCSNHNLYIDYIVHLPLQHELQQRYVCTRNSSPINFHVIVCSSLALKDCRQKGQVSLKAQLYWPKKLERWHTLTGIY